MKKKKKEYITHSQLIHIFAQGKVKDLESSTKTMSIKGRTLYYNSLPVAVLYSVRKKIVIVTADWDNSGAYNSGESTYSILCSFSNEWTKFIADKIIPDVSQSDREKNRLQLSEMFNYYIKLYLKKLTGNIRIVKNYARSGYGSRYSHEAFKIDINKLSIFPYFKRMFTSKVNIIEHGEYWEGWKRHYERIDYKGRIDNLYHNGYFTKEEQYKIDRVKWIHKYIYGTQDGARWNKKQKEELYDDEARRNVYVAEHEKRVKIQEKLWKQQQAELQLKRKTKAQDGINDWIDNDVRNLTDAWLIPVELKLYNNIVLTSKGSEVPIDHAQRVYKAFKLAIKYNKPFQANGKTIAVGHFNVSKIDKNDIGWYLIAGCHTIYEDAIDRFIDKFKPEWKKEII